MRGVESGPRGGVVAAGEQEAQVVAQEQRVDRADVRVEQRPDALAVLDVHQHHLMLRDHLHSTAHTNQLN